MEEDGHYMAVDFSPESDFLVVSGGGSADNSLKIFDHTSGETIYTYENYMPHKIAVSPDGKYIAIDNMESVVLLNAHWEVTSVSQNSANNFSSSIYPNPFNNKTNISLNIENPCNTTIEIFDLLGNHIKTINHEYLEAGYHNIPVNMKGISSGLYICKIKCGNEIRTLRMYAY